MNLTIRLPRDQVPVHIPVMGMYWGHESGGWISRNDKMKGTA